MTRRRGYAIAIFFVVLFALFSVLFWRVPVRWKIETLNLPEGCEMVYPLKMEITDVHWWHISGEKVLRCEEGYQAAKEYIETHNSALKLHNLRFCGYGAMSCDYIYDSEEDPYFAERYDTDEYIKIIYEKKLSW